MPRRYLLFEPGHFYHLYNREANKEPMFFYDSDYLHFLKLWRKYALSSPITLVAYCLMPTHFHLLVRIDAPLDLSKIISVMLTAYAKWLNTKYNRSGLLFKDRFKAIHVDQQEHLLHLCRYIHLNPFAAGLVNNVEKWPFSNYLEFIGKRKGGLFDINFRNELFGTTEQYRQFVEDFALQYPRGFKKVMIDE